MDTTQGQKRKLVNGTSVETPTKKQKLSDKVSTDFKATYNGNMAAVAGLDTKQVASYIEASWKKDVEKTLCEYIEIPNQSPGIISTECRCLNSDQRDHFQSRL